MTTEEREKNCMELYWSSHRIEIAKFAMMGILANWGKGFAGNSDDIPQRAVKFADKLIEELNKK